MVTIIRSLPPSPAHSSCLESLYTLSLYDELSAAVEEGVGEHRLMTLGNQSCSQLQTGANQKEGPPTLREDEPPPCVWEDPSQQVQELPRTGTPLSIIKFVMI